MASFNFKSVLLNIAVGSFASLSFDNNRLLITVTYHKCSWTLQIQLYNKTQIHPQSKHKLPKSNSALLHHKVQSTSEKKLDTLAYQQIVMPFLEPIVYPTKRDKDDVEQTIYIRNVLGSWQEKQNGKKLRMCTKKKIPKETN